MNSPLLLSIAGPTAAGKTDLAIRMAQHFHTEIISVDSRQFYRELEIGTAKPTAAELAQVKHHFINSHTIDTYYSAGQYERDARHLLEQLFQNHQVVIAVGGSGLFFKALWEGMDEMPPPDLALREKLNSAFEQNGLQPLLAELEAADPNYFHQVDQKNHQRVIRALEVIRSSGRPFSSFRKGKKATKDHFQHLKIGLELDRPALYARIDQRMDQMIGDGLFEEAEKLLPYHDHNALQTVGYSEIFGYMDGKYDKEEAIRLLKRNSRRYAKRQMTWFKKDPEICWLAPDQEMEVIRMVEERLASPRFAKS